MSVGGSINKNTTYDNTNFLFVIENAYSTRDCYLIAFRNLQSSVILLFCFWRKKTIKLKMPNNRI